MPRVKQKSVFQRYYDFNSTTDGDDIYGWKERIRILDTEYPINVIALFIYQRCIFYIDLYASKVASFRYSGKSGTIVADLLPVRTLLPYDFRCYWGDLKCGGGSASSQ